MINNNQKKWNKSSFPCRIYVVWLLNIHSLTHLQRREQVLSLAAELNATGTEYVGPKQDEQTHTEELQKVLENIQVNLKTVSERLAFLEDQFAEENRQPLEDRFQEEQQQPRSTR